MAAGTFSATAGARHLGWLAVVGLLAVPLLIGGILTWALATPTAHLDRVTAAIVNDDEPVTVNGHDRAARPAVRRRAHRRRKRDGCRGRHGLRR